MQVQLDGPTVRQEAKCYLANPTLAQEGKVVELFEKIAAHPEWCQPNKKATRALIRAISLCYLKTTKSDVKENIRRVILDKFSQLSPFIAKCYLAKPTPEQEQVIIVLFEQVAANPLWCQLNQKAARAVMGAISLCYLNTTEPRVKEKIHRLVLDKLSLLSIFIPHDLTLEQVPAHSLLLVCQSDYFARRFGSGFQERKLLESYLKSKKDPKLDFKLEPYTPDVVAAYIGILEGDKNSLQGLPATRFKKVSSLAKMTFTQEKVESAIMDELKRRWAQNPIFDRDKPYMYRWLRLCPNREYNEMKDPYMMNLVKGLPLEEIFEGVETGRIRSLPFFYEYEAKSYGYEILMSLLGEWFHAINHQIHLISKPDKKIEEAMSLEQRQALQCLRRFHACANKSGIFHVRGPHFAPLNDAEIKWLIEHALCAEELNFSGAQITNDSVLKEFEDYDLLKKVSFANCKQLESLYTIRNCGNIQFLDISNCEKLDRFEEAFKSLRRLKQFKYIGCPDYVCEEARKIKLNN